ncbi:undecaprenyl-diphosphate phosphatase [Patescibacteria group bacterium]
MEIIQAFVLGIVQGFTEFLPVSSSGHLVIFREVFLWPDQGLFFDVILHLGTLVALAVFFRKEIIGLLKAFVRIMKTGKIYDDTGKKLLVHLVLGTVPIVIVGVVILGNFEAYTRDLGFVGVMLILTSVVLAGTVRIKKATQKVDDMNIRKALLVGMSQVFGLFPGISRSGMTIATGNYLGLSRDQAARFSFLLGFIGILAANTLLVVDVVKTRPEIDWAPLLVGFVASAVMSYLVVKYFIEFLKKYKLTVFAAYAFGLGVVLLLVNWFAL